MIGGLVESVGIPYSNEKERKHQQRALKVEEQVPEKEPNQLNIFRVNFSLAMRSVYLLTKGCNTILFR